MGPLGVVRISLLARSKVCVLLSSRGSQPYANTQVAEAPDVLNVGGFGDAVWEVVAAFSRGERASGRLVEAIERVEL